MTSPIQSGGIEEKNPPQTITAENILQWSKNTSRLPPKMIVGGTGTGKTAMLVADVVDLIIAGRRTDEITVLTFSGSAAEKMKAEIEQSVDEKKLLANTNDIFVGTPESFCLKFLRAVRVPPLNLGPDFILWDQQTCAGVIKRLSDNPDLRNRPIRPEELLRLMEWHSLNCHRHDLGDMSAEDGSWHRLKGAFNREKRRLQALDFGEVTLFTILTLQKDSALCDRLSRGRTRHLLFDDFHECTTLQYALFRLLTRHSRSVTIAADPNQQIYASRGSNVGLLQRFVDDYQVEKPCHLTLNHRATGALVNVAKTLQESTDLAGLQPDHQESVRLSGAHPQLLVHDGPIGELDQSAVDIIESLHDHDGYEWEDIAVLYPNSSAGSRIATRLGAHRIPYQVLDQFVDPVASDLELVRSLLCVAAQPRDEAAFHKAATAGLNQDQVTRVDSLMPQIVDIARQSSGDLVHATDRYLQQGRRDSVMVRRLRHVVDAVTMLRRELTHPNADIASIVRTACHQVARTTQSGTLPILCRLIAAAESFTSAGRRTSHDRLIEFLDHLAVSSDPVQCTPVTAPLFYPPDGVALGTIRSSQGRQWKAVLLVDCTDEAIPGDLDNVVDVYEPERLFYVAVSRPADKLYLLVPLVGDALQQQTPSRFIAPLHGILERRQV